MMADPTPASPSPGTPAPAPARDRRRRALRWGAASGVTARLVSVGCTLATVPMALRHLGGEAYGLWMTVASLATLLSLLDFGLGSGARNLLAQAYGLNDLARMRTIAGVCFRRLALGGLVVAGLGSGAAHLFDWAALFNVTDPRLAAQLPAGLTILALGSGLALPLSLAVSYAAAIQRPWITNTGTAVGGALLLAGVALAARFAAGWPIWVALIVGLPLAINAAMALYLIREFGWSRRTPAGGPAGWPPGLGRLSFWFFIPQAGALFAQAAPPLVIAVLVGPEPVAAFNILQRIFGLIGQVHWMFVAPWWSAYTEAHAQRDFAWIRSSHRWSWWITAGLFVPGTLAAAFLTPLLIELWIGTHAMQPDALLVWLMAAWQTLQLLGQPPALLLNGLGQVRGAAIASMAGHLLSLVAMGWLGLRHGATGVVAGMMLGYAIVGLPGVLLTAGGQLRKLGRE